MTKRDYLCDFCMVILKGEFGVFPKECPHCQVFSCKKCLTFLRKDFRFCFGCGETSPELAYHCTPADGTAALYLIDQWKHRNLGRHSKGVHELAIHYSGPDCSDGSRSMTIRLNGIDVRELTSKEKNKYLKGKEQ